MRSTTIVNNRPRVRVDARINVEYKRGRRKLKIVGMKMVVSDERRLKLLSIQKG